MQRIEYNLIWYRWGRRGRSGSNGAPVGAGCRYRAVGDADAGRMRGADRRVNGLKQLKSVLTS